MITNNNKKRERDKNCSSYGDCYFTHPKVIKHHVDLLNEIVTDPFVFVDFSAGNGELGKYFKPGQYLGFDIAPSSPLSSSDFSNLQQTPQIQTQDWLESNPQTDQTILRFVGRHSESTNRGVVRVLGYNPPFGRAGILVNKFMTCNRTLKVVDPDYVLLILPVRSEWPEITKNFFIIYREYLKRGSFYLPPHVDHIFETASEFIVCKRLRENQEFVVPIIPFKVRDSGTLNKWWTNNCLTNNTEQTEKEERVWLLVRKVGEYAGRQIYYIKGNKHVFYFGATQTLGEGKVQEFVGFENPWQTENGHIVCEWDEPSEYKGSNPRGESKNQKRQGTGFLKVTSKGQTPDLCLQQFQKLANEFEKFIVCNNLNCGNPKSITASIVERFFVDIKCL